MSETDTYTIRPAGRHILTIGRDLVQSPHAALIELIKNAYDADSADVVVRFDRGKDENYRVSVTDHGHGMSRDTVINNWMVPSTTYKEERDGESPGGRPMQGRKGIGRYAASILGKDLLLETITASREKTTLYLQWEDFEKAEFLDDVEILIETTEVNEPAGTTLVMVIDEGCLANWNSKEFEKLQFELKKLIPPFYELAMKQAFAVTLQVADFPGVKDTDTCVEPYPLVEHFDYRITGTITADGSGCLEYSEQKSRSSQNEKMSIKLDNPTRCGDLEIDIRVYDRDATSIEQLIQRGLKDDRGNYLGKLQARQLLNEYNGIGVYRNGFRLRPLGDPEFDWLKLNEQRIQTPARRIGSNQVIGYVQIQSEKRSGLIEKSARDGLIENDAFGRLKVIMKIVIARLEEKRYIYRRRKGLGRRVLNVESELEKLYSFEELKSDVRSTLKRGRVGKKTTSQVIHLLETDEQRRNETANRLRDAIAVYQGHATLGKIINVVLHEGRRPLSYFRNQFPLLRGAASKFSDTSDPDLISKIVELAEGIADNAADFVALFERLDPLAAQRRSKRKPEPLGVIIEQAVKTFAEELKEAGIVCTVNGDSTFTLLCWRQDIQAIFTNLIDNSIYWLKVKEFPERRITIDFSTDGGRLLYVDYKDTGPGIEPEYIENSIIFDPQFSTKPEGTGLGLAIAGEGAIRNGLELTAKEHECGAWFRLQPVSNKESVNGGGK